ncbi:MAG: MFS transporter [Candidatus Saccharibacteria bacterium]
MERFKAYSRSTFASLSIYNYRLYFIGQGISLTGTWIQTIAQTWLIFTLTHSGTYIGLLTAVQFLPVLLLGPAGGLVADRFPKRRIIYVTQTVSMLLALVMAALVLSHTVQPWMVFVLAGLLGLVQVVDTPTRQTFIMEMAGRDNLTNAVTLNSVEVNMARIIGPAIAGGLIAGIGIGYCFLANGLSYIAVLFCLLLMRGHELHADATIARAKGQLREGFRYVQRTPVLRNILLMMAVIGTFSYEFPVLLPIYAGNTFHHGAGGYSLLMGAMGLGAVIGGVISANRRKPSPAAITLAASAFGVAMLLAAIAPDIWVAAALMVLVGIGSISFTALASSTLQLQTAPEMRGRVMALWTVAFIGSTPIGGPIIGYVSEHASARLGFLIGGVAALGSGLFAIYIARRVRLRQPIEPQLPAAG